MDTPNLAANAERFSGFADLYEAVRPQPPPLLRDILTQLAETKRVALVVDLGSGTGLSTRFWAGAAARVIDIEPSEDMRRQARVTTTEPNVEYLPGFSHATGLPDDCADIVTCSQSFHWMEPQSTLKEAARVLRRGGVFAVYDCDWPPLTSNWRADRAFIRFMERVHQIERERQLSPEVRRWSKDQHLANIEASAMFRHTRSFVLHHMEQGNAERLVGIALSQGSTMTLLKHSLTEEEIGLDELRQDAARFLGGNAKPWLWSYYVRLGIV